MNQQQPGQQQIPLQAQPEILRGVYSNNMQVIHTKEEFEIDFLALSYVPQVMNLVAKVFTNPIHFKRVVIAFNENLKKYEDKFGPISIENTQQPTTPSSTSDQPFGFGSK